MVTKLDEIMNQTGLNNHDLVSAYQNRGGQLAHKTVQKARLGKRALSRKMEIAVTEALNAALERSEDMDVAMHFKRETLFPKKSM